MAKARKCDRCGMCFDPMEQKDEMVRFQNPIFQNAQSIKETRVLRRLLNDSPDAYVDLCPTCTLLFERFMKNEYEQRISMDYVLGRAMCMKIPEEKKEETPNA